MMFYYKNLNKYTKRYKAIKHLGVPSNGDKSVWRLELLF